MLEIVIPAGGELWNDAKEEFIINEKEHVLKLEHSLVSVQKWESKWHKMFLSKQSKTQEELIDYIKCMTITQNVDPNVYYFLTDRNLEQIKKYLEDPMTATVFPKEGNKQRSQEIPTAELIYYWMIAYNIPFKCKKWHLNSLLALIRVCSIKNQPTNKMGRNELLSRNAALNAARKQRLNSKG